MATESGEKKVEPIMAKPVLEVDGKVFDRWKNVSISKDLDQTTSTFNFSVGPLVTLDHKDWVETLTPGKQVIVKFSGDQLKKDFDVITGFIETQSIRSSGTDESLEISGRCVMGLLVDCTARLDLAIARKRTLKDVAEELIKPFNVIKNGKQVPAFASEVEVNLPDDLKKDVTSQLYDKKPAGPEPNQKCEDLLRKLVGDKDCDLWLSSDGKLVIGNRLDERSSADPEVCLYTFRDKSKVQYNNFKESQITHTISGRFSEYKVYGRIYKATATAFSNPAACAQADDATVPIYKPLHEKLDKADKPDLFQKKATANKDAGYYARYQLSGTAVGYGQLVDNTPHVFELNQVVDVVNEVGRVKGRFYISKLSYSNDASGGPQTSMTLRMLNPDEAPS